MNDDAAPSPETVHLRLDGFEGPLDLLLDLARRQQVDFARISILTLVDQYLVAVTHADQANLSRVAEWLVMAAWLTWLKSRLLLPKETNQAKEAEQAARILTGRLAKLEHVRAVTAWLETRPQLGRDIFERANTDAMPGPVVVTGTGFASLMEAYLAVLRGRPRSPNSKYYHPPRHLLWMPPHALARMQAMLGELPEGSDILSFVPQLRTDLPDRTFRIRAAIASTFVASLMLAHDGKADLRQDEPWGPITVLARTGPPQSEGEPAAEDLMV